MQGNQTHVDGRSSFINATFRDVTLIFKLETKGIITTW